MKTKKFSLSRMRIAERAILHPVKAAIRESTVAQDVHSVHVFIASVLTAATRLTAVTTRADSVRKDLVPDCRTQVARSREAIAHARTATVADITATVVDTRAARSREVIAHATTTMVRKVVTSHVKVDTTTVVDTRAVRSKEAIVHATTTMKTDTSHSLTVHATMPTTVLRAKRTTAIRLTRVVISHVKAVTSHVRVAIRTEAVTTTVVDITTTAVAIRTVADTTTEVDTTTEAVITRVVIASIVLIMTQMQSIHSRSA